MKIRRLFYTAVVTLILGGVLGVTNAQSPTTIPIIARVENRLYQVWTEMGDSRLLYEAPIALSEVLKNNFSGNGVTLEGRSPNNSYLAFTAGLRDILDSKYADQLTALAQRNPNDVYIVGISSGERINVTKQVDHLADAVVAKKIQNYSHVVWSPDGSAVYFSAETRSLDDQPAVRSLSYYDLTARELHEVLPSAPVGDTYVMGLYPMANGVAEVVRLDNNGNFQFILVSPDGKIQNRFEFHLDGTMDVNAWMFDLNPVRLDSSYSFGYFTIPASGPQPNYLNVTNGETSPAPADSYLTMLSHTSPEASFRVVLKSFEVGGFPWAFADKDGNRLYVPEEVEKLDNYAIAPDGQSIAYIWRTPLKQEDRKIVVFDGHQARALSFVADEIQWGSVDYIFAPMH